MVVECAPMAGYTNAEFRRVLITCGASTVYTEMVSAAAIFYGNKKTLKLLERATDYTSNGTHPREIVQLFGHKVEHFVFAIKNGYCDGFDEININMGCPANKIIKNNEGVALMTREAGNIERQEREDMVADVDGGWGRAREIITACVGVSRVPVSVKMRLGKTVGCDYVAFAKMCENAGASRLIVHGRYGSQGYSGTTNWGAIGEIVRAVKIPVIANGDIRCAGDAVRCIAETGAVGVMVGRALLPLYKKYFSGNLRIIRGEKICRDGGIGVNINNILELLGGRV